MLLASSVTPRAEKSADNNVGASPTMAPIVQSAARTPRTSFTTFMAISRCLCLPAQPAASDLAFSVSAGENPCQRLILPQTTVEFHGDFSYHMAEVI